MLQFSGESGFPEILRVLVPEEASPDELGDPLRELVGQSVSEEIRNELREELGLNDPFLVQYWRFLKNAVRGDLGTSYFFKRPALEVILDKLPATIDLVISASFWILLFSIPVACLRQFEHHWISKLTMGLSILGISIPVFLTAIFLIQIFAVELGWAPSYGRGDTVVLFGFWETSLLTWDGLTHVLLPSISLASVILPLFVRMIRSEMMEVLETEYVKFAWAKGLSKPRIWIVHAFKNTLLPVITVGGVQLGIMVAYTILTETVFQWPGMGFMFLEAINRVDTPLIVAYLIVVGLIFVITNTIVDIIYGFVNPMVKLTGR